MTIIDQVLLKDVEHVVLGTIARFENRNDLWKLAGEISLEITAFIQNRDAETHASLDKSNLKRKPVDLATKLAINSSIEKNATPNTTGGADVSSGADFSNSTNNTTQKINLPENNLSTTNTEILTDSKSEPAENPIVEKNATIAKNAHDDSEIPNSHNEDDPVGPIWLSQTINWSEYWVYDYSNPVTTLNGKCGRKCAQTEIWLVHRRKYKLSLVDAEFASVATMHDFLGPLKELAKENKIQPLEVIDEELAGKDKKQRDACRIAKQQSKFGLFLECYDLFHGDAVKISEKMGIAKQSVYAYKNKAKTMGVLK